MTSKTVWIVGTWDSDGEWVFEGVFDTEAAAVNRCRDETFFVAPAVVNKELPYEHTSWPGLYFPKRGASE